MTDRRVSTLLAKAERTLSGARLLHAAHDTDGACSRAYQAMFDGARAALLAVPGGSETSAKTHRGLIAAFSRQLVVAGLADVRFSGALNRVQELRLLADYLGDPVTAEQAAWAVSEAEAFVAEMQRVVASVGADKDE